MTIQHAEISTGGNSPVHVGSGAGLRSAEGATGYLGPVEQGGTGGVILAGSRNGRIGQENPVGRWGRRVGNIEDRVRDCLRNRFVVVVSRVQASRTREGVGVTGNMKDVGGEVEIKVALILIVVAVRGARAKPGFVSDAVLFHAGANIPGNVPWPIPDTGPYGELVAIIPGVHVNRQSELLGVVKALDALGLFLGFGQGRQKERGEDGNDSDDHEQLNQSETTAARAKPVSQFLAAHKIKSQGTAAGRLWQAQAQLLAPAAESSRLPLEAVESSRWRSSAKVQEVVQSLNHT